MNHLFILNRLSWPIRLPIKWALFGISVLIVCFPYPNRLVAHIKHWRDPNLLIEPNAPVIQSFIEELRPQLNEQQTASETLNTIQNYVYARIPYAWDWLTWGVADYLPTLSEVVAAGHEDCDGRAVVAASLLRSFGHEASIVTDFTHVWVKTELGETMGPGSKKAVVATKKGLQVQKGALAQLPRSFSYGIAVFPWQRELIILVVAWLLMLRRGGGALCNTVAMALLLDGLVFLRIGGKDHTHLSYPVLALGLVNTLGGVFVLLVWARYNARAATALASKSKAEPRHRRAEQAARGL
ncbi:MAG: hypothetical protein ACE5HE_00350 [Phycisphaerae bacterium]